MKKKAVAKKAPAKKKTPVPLAKPPKPVVRGDGMLSTKEVSRVYNKAKNKKGKFDPTKIPGFGYGKGNR